MGVEMRRRECKLCKVSVGVLLDVGTFCYRLDFLLKLLKDRLKRPLTHFCNRFS